MSVHTRFQVYENFNMYEITIKIILGNLIQFSDGAEGFGISTCLCFIAPIRPKLPKGFFPPFLPGLSISLPYQLLPWVGPVMWGDAAAAVFRSFAGCCRYLDGWSLSPCV